MHRFCGFLLPYKGRDEDTRTRQPNRDSVFEEVRSLTPPQVLARKTTGNAVKVCKHCGQQKAPEEFAATGGTGTA
jgi:hypothetical protein